MNPKNEGSRHSEVLLLDVVEDEGEGLGLLTVVLDGDGRGSLDFTGGAVLVVMAVSEPFTEIHSGVNLDQGDAGSLGHSLLKSESVKLCSNDWAVCTYGNKLLVFGILAISGENADKSLLSVKCLKDLVESLDKS